MAITVDGIDEVVEFITDIADVNDIKKVVGNGCALVERVAKKTAPKKSGDLRKSIESRVEIEGNNIIGIISSPLEYAPYVEYGTGLFAEKQGRKDVPWAYRDEETNKLIFTSGQHPQPFLRPALNNNREEILRILREGIGR